jgi:hypothetical protein
MTWIVTFLAVAAADVCWTKYMAAAGAGQRWLAGMWGAALYMIGAVAVVQYTTDHWLLIPAATGAFVGTAIGVNSK